MLQLPKWMLRNHRLLLLQVFSLRTGSSVWFHSPFEGRLVEFQEIGTTFARSNLSDFDRAPVESRIEPK